MKKLYLLLTGLLLLVLSVAGCGGQQEQEAAKGNDGKEVVLRVGAQPYPLYASVYAAKEKGYLEEELAKVGAKYEWNDFKSGPLVNEAVKAGHADIGFMADMPAILARSSGQDIQIISDVAFGEKALALIVKTDSPINSVADIKGKKIAYGKGTYAQHLLSLLLTQNDLTFDDIQSVNLAAGDIPSALASGQIDGAVIWEQYISQTVTEGKARVVADGTGIKRGNLVTYAVTSYAKENPKVIEAYIRAIKRGGEFIKEQPKEAAELLSKDFKVEPKVLERIFQNLDYSPALTPADVEEIKKVKDYLFEQKLIETDIDADEFINLSYLQSAGVQ